MPADQPSRPGRRCARIVLALLRDGRTRPEQWDRRERGAVTRLHLWAHREQGLPSWPLPWPAQAGAPVARVRVEEDKQGLRLSGTLLADSRDFDEDPDRFAEQLLADLRRLGDEYGPLGVAIAAATLTDPRVLVAQINPDRAALARPTVAEPEHRCPTCGVRLTEPVEQPEPVVAHGDAVNLVGYSPGDTYRVRVGDWRRTASGQVIVEAEVAGDEAPARVESRPGIVEAYRARAERAEHTEATWRREVDEQTARAEREHAARLEAERERDEARRMVAAEQQRLAQQLDEANATLALYRHRYGSRLEWTEEQADRPADAHEPIELYVPESANVTCDGTRLRALYLRPHHGEVGSEQYADGKGRPLTMDDVRAETGGAIVRGPWAESHAVRGGIRYPSPDRVPHEPIDLRPLEEDPRRPHAHPSTWPDDAVLLRYAELRRLVSLHLERYADARTARSMLEGDVPLRLSEVLDR